MQRIVDNEVELGLVGKAEPDPAFCNLRPTHNHKTLFHSREGRTETDEGVMEDANGERKRTKEASSKSDFHGATCRLKNVMHEGRIVAKSTVEISR